MPPSLATLVYLIPVVWLFRRDFRERPNVTAALWLPFFWIFISGTRFVSGWLAIFGLNIGAGSQEEGSPVDAFFFFILIIAGLHVLHKRNVTLAKFFRENYWITIYLFYCFIAITWSDFPFVSAKRWVKLFGQPVMALIVLTEPDPVESLTRLMKRFAYIVVPISILFIKYFPQWSTAYDNWTGGRMNTGITTDKNALGCDCFILSFFFVWHWLRIWRLEKGSYRRNELILSSIFLVFLGWLLHVSDSSSPLATLMVSLIILFFLGFKFVNAQKIGTYLVFAIIIFSLAEIFFNIHETLIHALGRNTTLTGRTEIWQILLHWDINPILGAGFESFWMGTRVERMSQLLPGAIINEAHNGYLETYIQLGLIGVFFTMAMLLATYFKVRRALLIDFDFARFRLAYLIAFIVYNCTEALFRTHAFPFFMFFLIAIDFPFSSSRQLQEPLASITRTAHVI